MADAKKLVVLNEALCRMDSDSDSYTEEGSNKRKKTTKSRASKRQITEDKYGQEPEVPEIAAHEEDSEDDEDDLQEQNQHAKSEPLIIHVNHPNAKNFKIEIDLADGAVKTSSDQPATNPEDTMTTLPNDSNIANVVSQLREAHNRPAHIFAGFLDLPLELRQRFYDQLFVTEGGIDLTKRKGFERSAAFLRTCKKVHEEGCRFLYGRNSFHLTRSTVTRGRFCEPVWKQIGYKDIRRFLETIGPINLSMIKYISIVFSNPTSSAANQNIEDSETHFASDPTLHHSLRLIGSQATLDRLVVSIKDQYVVGPKYYYFLKAIATIKCHKVRIVDTPLARSNARFDATLRQMSRRMKKVMEIPDQLMNAADLERIRNLSITTILEEDPSQLYYGEVPTMA